MGANLAVGLSEAESEAFGRELEVLQAEVRADLGERDGRYIRRLIATERRLRIAGRLGIFASLALLPSWGHPLAHGPLFLAAMGAGVLALALAKILENMEIAHNVMHGQWDWLRDPAIDSRTWEWDNVCPAALWRHSHNVVHHTWTNVLGLDRDLGYGPLRVSERQRWHPSHLLQPLSNLALALFFEWAVAFHDVRFARLRRGEVPWSEGRAQLRQIARKIARQAAREYVLWPLLAGPFFLYVLVANAAAGVLRNLWLHLIIFCGHFPAGVHVFTPDEVRDESRGGWYVRQVVGTCNISGGRLFHVLSGNLGHQIEHHLFPLIPSHRYAELAPRVRAICARYGVPYHTASLGRQVASTTRQIVRLSLPRSGAQ